MYERLVEIRTPTPIIVGDEDVAAPLETARRLKEAIGGSIPDVITRAGHSSSIENPDAVTEAITAFLAR